MLRNLKGARHRDGRRKEKHLDLKRRIGQRALRLADDQGNAAGGKQGDTAPYPRHKAMRGLQ